jgi:lipid A 3-O-deacylase
LKRIEGLVLFLLLAGTATVAAQAPQGGFVLRGPYQQTMAPDGTGEHTATLESVPSDLEGAPPETMNPVAEIRTNRSWEYGPFVNWGTGVGDRANYKFFWGGFELAKVLTPVLHAGIFSGQFEYGGNIMPLWQAYTPAPHPQAYTCEMPGGQPYTCYFPFGGGTFRGVSLTPVIFRWNFLTKSRRIQPWFQAAGGLIYTTHEFPPNVMSNNNPANGPIIDGSTSVWNFAPQGGIGLHYFLKSKRSIDLGVNAVHISSASLGDRNPGVNASIQIQVGYTFWK